MDRNALLLYLKDIRDLKITKRKIETIYDNEYSKVVSNLQSLREENFYSEEIDVGVIAVGGLLAVFFGGLAYFFHWQSGRWANDLLSKAVALFLKLLYFASLGLCIVLIIACIVMFVRELIDCNKAQKHNEYERQIVRNNNNKADELEKIWIKRDAYLKSEYEKVKNLLNEYYDLNIVPMPRQDFGTTRNSQNNGAKRGNLGHLLCHETTRRLLFSRIKVGNVIVIVKRYLR